MDGIIDLTGEDSDSEISDPFNCSSDDDLKPANINASGNNIDCVRRYYNLTEAGPSTSQSTHEQRHINADDYDTDFVPQEDEDVGWPPKDVESENDFDDEVVPWQETEDQAFNWQQDAMSPAAHDSDSHEGEEIGFAPKDADPNMSLKCFHPLSDSDHSEAPSSPPPKRIISNNYKPTATNNTATKEASPSKTKRKRKTPEEKANEEAEKQLNRRRKEALKRLRPENCLNHIVVELDTAVTSIPALSVMYLNPPLNQLKHKLKERNVPYSVGWYREVMSEQDEDVEECRQLMLQILPMDFLENLVYNNQLMEHVSELFEDNRNISQIAFVVFDSKQYFKNHSGKKKKVSGTISKNRLEEAIAECQIEKGVTFRMLDTAQEVGEWIYRYSKSIAEHPYKQSKKTWQENFRFDLEVEKGQGLRIGTAAEGLPQLWLKILQKFRRAPLEICQAISEAYPSPSALISAYENCDSEEDAKKLLQYIQVQRGAGPMAVSRNIGPVLSRKIHTLFTSIDPAILLSES